VGENGGGKCRTKVEVIESLMSCFKTPACSGGHAVCTACRQLSGLAVVSQDNENGFTRRMVADPGGWILSPTTIQAHGSVQVDPSDYESRLYSLERLLQAPTYSHPRCHPLRHCAWWNNDDHANALDELTALLEVLEKGRCPIQPVLADGGGHDGTTAATEPFARHDTPS
jgi:hypothetical protein